MADNESTGCFSHKDLHEPRIEKRRHMYAFVELVEKSWVNPQGPDESDVILSPAIAVLPDKARNQLQR